MTRFGYRLRPRAERYLRRAQPNVQAQLVARFRVLCEAPYDPNVSQPMQGRHDGLRKSRVGSLRILFYVDDEIRIVDVAAIGPRGDIYKGA